MSTQPPPPRDPRFLPREEPPGTGRLVLKVVLFLAGGFAILLVVGFGLLWAMCGGL